MAYKKSKITYMKLLKDMLPGLDAIWIELSLRDKGIPVKEAREIAKQRTLERRDERWKEVTKELKRVAEGESEMKKYTHEERWFQIVISISKPDRQLKGALNALARRNEISLSKQIVNILRDYCKKHRLL
jgi:hypothetical protein